MLAFPDRSHLGQIRAIRRAVLKLLAEQGLDRRSLKLACHAYNTTFRLETTHGEAALRVYIGSNRTLNEVRGEVAWTEALHRDGRVAAPDPIPLFAGSPLAFAQIEGIERDIPVVAYRWLSGRHVGRNRPVRSGWLLGRVMRDLHEMTREWSLPAGTSRPVLRDAVDSLPWRLGEGGPFGEVFERANAILARQAPHRQLTHFDLHFGNVKVWRGGMSVFDFDDAVFASPGADAAQAMYYLRRGLDSPIEAAFWRGLGRSLDDFELTPSDFEMLIGGRALLLATDLLGTQSAALAELAPRYVEASRIRVEHLLRTGRFDPSVAKV